MSSSTISGKRLLILGDNSRRLTSMSASLSKAGYDVQRTSSPDRVVAEFERRKIDLAILSAEGQAAAGAMEMLRCLRDRGHDAPFVVHGLFDRDLVRSAAECGALSYVVMPAPLNRLVATIEAVLARAAEARELRDTARQLQQALNGDRDISVAIGMVMLHKRISKADAFNHLRSNARSMRRTLADVARHMILAVEKRQQAPGMLN